MLGTYNGVTRSKSSTLMFFRFCVNSGVKYLLPILVIFIIYLIIDYYYLQPKRDKKMQSDFEKYKLKKDNKVLSQNDLDNILRYTQGINKDTPLEEKIKCPMCKSEQLTSNKKGFGLGKAVAGGLVAGGLGLLGGFIGSRNILLSCLKCGHNWNAGKKN